MNPYNDNDGNNLGERRSYV